MPSTNQTIELTGLFDEPDRICRHCRVQKPATEFHRKRHLRSGRLSICRTCRAATREKRVDTPESKLRKVLVNEYGITLEQYQLLLDEQGGLCAMCGRPPRAKESRLAVDHCHTSHRVRALLCMRCNTMLGAFEAIRQKAVLYLEQYGDGNPLIDHEVAARLRHPKSRTA